MKTLLKIITGYIVIAFILGFLKGLLGRKEEDDTEK
jgi:hypothetical protein